MGELFKVPWKFYIDHYERGLPTPDDCGATKRHVWISKADPYLGALLSDAEEYCHPYGPGSDQSEYRNLRASAKATVAAIQKVRGGA